MNIYKRSEIAFEYNISLLQSFYFTCAVYIAFVPWDMLLHIKMYLYNNIRMCIGTKYFHITWKKKEFKGKRRTQYWKQCTILIKFIHINYIKKYMFDFIHIEHMVQYERQNAQVVSSFVYLNISTTTFEHFLLFIYFIFLRNHVYRSV
jgi:hypothetical protein